MILLVHEPNTEQGRTHPHRVAEAVEEADGSRPAELRGEGESIADCIKPAEATTSKSAKRRARAAEAREDEAAKRAAAPGTSAASTEPIELEYALEIGRIAARCSALKPEVEAMQAKRKENNTRLKDARRKNELRKLLYPQVF